jgi:hypothetical protein
MNYRKSSYYFIAIVLDEVANVQAIAHSGNIYILQLGFIINQLSKY